MRYDISNMKAPKMPNLGKGTECIKFLLTQASKDRHEPLVPMLFPSLGAHISSAEFQYPDRSWKETCGMIVPLVANSLILSMDLRNNCRYEHLFMSKTKIWIYQKNGVTCKTLC